MKPIPQQVKDEITALRELRDKIPKRSKFGNDNLARIDAEIDVLEHNLSEDEIVSRYGTDAVTEKFADADIDIYQEAMYARQWIDGEAQDGAMSDGWRATIKKKQPK